MTKRSRASGSASFRDENDSLIRVYEADPLEYDMMGKDAMSGLIMGRFYLLLGVHVDAVRVCRGVSS